MDSIDWVVSGILLEALVLTVTSNIKCRVFRTVNETFACDLRRGKSDFPEYYCEDLSSN